MKKYPDGLSVLCSKGVGYTKQVQYQLHTFLSYIHQALIVSGWCQLMTRGSGKKMAASKVKLSLAY